MKLIASLLILSYRIAAATALSSQVSSSSTAASSATTSTITSALSSTTATRSPIPQSASPSPASSASAPRSGPVDITVNAETSNNIANLGIAGDTAGRDQSNAAVFQTNNAQQQIIIGSTTDSHAVNIANTASVLFSSANTTITNTDLSQHDDTESNIFNDNEVHNQQMINNNQQSIQNIYEYATSINKTIPVGKVYYTTDPSVLDLLSKPEMLAIIINAKAISDLNFSLAIAMFRK